MLTFILLSSGIYGAVRLLNALTPRDSLPSTSNTSASFSDTASGAGSSFSDSGSEAGSSSSDSFFDFTVTQVVARNAKLAEQCASLQQENARLLANAAAARTNVAPICVDTSTQTPTFAESVVQYPGIVESSEETRARVFINCFTQTPIHTFVDSCVGGTEVPVEGSMQTDEVRILTVEAFDEYVRSIARAQVAIERYNLGRTVANTALADLGESMFINRAFARAMVDTVTDGVPGPSLARFFTVNQAYMDYIAKHPKYRVAGDLEFLARCKYKGDILYSAYEPASYSVMPSLLISLSFVLCVWLMSPYTRLYLRAKWITFFSK